MNITKNLSLAVAACSLGLGSVSAQFANTSLNIQSDSFANYRQVVPVGGSETIFFEAGAFAIDVRDGGAIFDGCVEPNFFFPSVIPPCPNGSTGQVVAGDLNGDGINDAGLYYGITNISTASLLQPFATSDARLVSAPPSLLPRPLSGFVDDSLTIFYNLFSPNIQKFDINRMALNRSYTAAQRNTFDREIVPGTYTFNFKRLVNPFFNGTAPPVAIALNFFPALDGFRKINNVKQGLRFKNVVYQDGFAVLDPLELNTIEWEGNTPSFIRPTSDLLYFSIKTLANPSDPLSDALVYDGAGAFTSNPAYDGFPSFIEPPNLVVDLDGDPEFIANPTLPIFPTFVGPETTRIVLPNSLVQQFILPPGFLAIGQTGIIDLEFVLNRPTTAFIADRSTRRFRLPVRLVSRFRTAIASRLPVTATALQKSADYDFDGDGASNFAEWAFGSDPANASSIPSLARLKTITRASDAVVGTSTRSGQPSPSTGLRYEVTKLVNPDPALDYSIEFSEDMKTWTKVTKTDPRFVVTDTAEKLVVATAGVPSEGGGFFRSKVQEK